jgi:ABC-2 type transport system permease protein
MLTLRRWRGQWALIGRITRLNLKARMEYRGEFVLGLMFGLVWQSAMVLFAGVLLTRFPGLGGWTQGGVLLIASMRLLSHSFYVATFQNIIALATTIQEGRVDGFLLRPMPLYQQVLLTTFRVNAFGDLLAGLGVFTIALLRLDIAWTPAKACYVAAAIIGGVLVEAAIQTLLSTAAFRFVGVASWNNWIDETISTFANYPLNVLPSTVRDTLTFILPVAFIAYLPAAVVTGRAASTGVPGWLALSSPVAGLVFFLAAKAAWYRSIRWYQSVGG